MGFSEVNTLGLLPCPFCGMSVQYVFDMDGYPCAVWCNTCHLKFEWSRIRINKKDRVGKAVIQIRDAWNKRN